ncbi:hypothetical protein ACFL2R_02535 [Patescibacteria group bacterium]
MADGAYKFQTKVFEKKYNNTAQDFEGEMNEWLKEASKLNQFKIISFETASPAARPGIHLDIDAIATFLYSYREEADENQKM